MNLANNLVVLGSGGSIEYTGAPEHWADYDRGLDFKDDGEPLESQFPDSSSSSQAPAAVEPKKVPATVQSIEDKGSQAESKPKRTSDLTDWLYYGKAIGKIPLLVFAFLITTAVFGVHFQSKSVSPAAIYLASDSREPTELWLKWNTEGHAPSVRNFIGIYTLCISITWLCQAGMIW